MTTTSELNKISRIISQSIEAFSKSDDEIRVNGIEINEEKQETIIEINVKNKKIKVKITQE